MACPNINSPQWKALVAKIGFNEAFREFLKHGEVIPPAENYSATFKGTDATTKVLKALTGDKVQGLFKRFFTTDPNKFYNELMQNGGVPKQQIDMLKAINEDNPPASLSEMAANVLAETAYTVQIEESRSANYNSDDSYYFNLDGVNYSMDNRSYMQDGDLEEETIYKADGKEISEEEYDAARKEHNSIGVPTQGYASLSVPGGTNYRENAIRIPGVPFATSDRDYGGYHDGDFNQRRGDMIGWFRSDEKIVVSKSDYYTRYKQETGAEGEYEDIVYSEGFRNWMEKAKNKEAYGVRRILEVQSGFQKLRGEKMFTVDNPLKTGTKWFDLVSQREFTIEHHYEGRSSSYSEEYNSFDPPEPETLTVRYEDGSRAYLYEEEIQDFLKKSIRHPDIENKINRDNNFLHLIGDENNWVTIFVQSIIQDSVRRNYEKVWFPSGDTAARIEGHETLEGYLRERKKIIDTYTERATREWQEQMHETNKGFIEDNVRASQEKYDKQLAIVAAGPSNISISEGDYYLAHGVIKDSNYEYNRVRLNNNENFNLTGDDYTGWVLHQYNTRDQERDTIIKISAEEARDLVYKSAVRMLEQDKKDLHNMQISLQRHIDNKESIVTYGIQDAENSMAHAKQEYDDAISGRTQLSSIARFYEKDVFNILKKRGYNPVRVQDEHGNEWFEVQAKPNYKETIFFNRKVDGKSMKFLEDVGLVEKKGDTYFVRKWNNAYVSDSAAIIDGYGDRYFERHGVRPFIVTKHSDGTYTVELTKSTDKVLPEVDNQGKQAITALAEKLKERFGVDYENIDSAKAQEITNGAYAGEGAFFLNGKVYFVDGHISLENVLHEYAHPLVMGLRKQNPRAYENLYKEIENSLDPSMLSILAQVRKLYPEYSESSDKFRDEVMVRAITAIAEGKINEKNAKTFLQRLWYRIKELLRALFGDSIDLSKIGPSLSLRDLADILALDYKKVDLSEMQEMTPLWNRDLARELESVNESQVMKNIEIFKVVLQKHLEKLKDGRNFAALREVLKNESDASIFHDMNSILRGIDNLSGSIEQNFSKLRGFANTIMSARIVSEKMKEHVLRMRESNIPEQEQLRTLKNYESIVDEWKASFDELRKMNVNDMPLLRKEIMETLDNYETIKDYTIQVYEHGVLDMLVKELKPVKDSVDAEYVDRLRELKEKADQGNEAAKVMYNRLNAEYDRFNFTEDNIRKYLRGEKGDTNRFSAFLVSYTNSPDPIVGGFATFLKKNFMKVESIIQEISTRMRAELEEPYMALKVDRSDPAELGKRLVANDKIPGYDENGEMYGHDVYVFMNEFHNGWLYDYKAKENVLNKALESGDEEAIRTATADFEQFKEIYFHREFVDEIYEAKKFWERDDYTRMARDERKRITSELKILEAITDNNQEQSEEDMEEIERLQKELRQLKSLKTPDGQDKTGDALEIAKALQEYANLTKNFYQSFEIKGSFERAYKNMLERLADKGIAEGTPEYEEAKNKWIRANVTFRLSEKFYSDRQLIIDEISEIINQLPAKVAANLDISARWKEIFDIIRGLRDQDGQPIGSDVSDEKVQQVKDIQTEINRIKTSMNALNGMTEEEAEKVGMYINMLEMGLAPTQEQYEEYVAILHKGQANQLSDYDKSRLFRAFEKLRAFQSKIPTEYYVERMNELMGIYNIPAHFRITTETADIINTPEFDEVLEQFPEFAKWFHANHLPKQNTWNAKTKEYDSTYERLYIWNRIVPNDPSIREALARNSYSDLLAIKSPYFEVRKANKYFFYRIKDEYKTGYNPVTGKVTREVGLHVDNRGNWLPKLTATDRKYINEEYFRLKNSTSPEDKHLYKILNTYKKYHLGVQNNAPKYARLWMEVPRRRKERIEIVRNPKKAAKDTWFNFKTGFVKAKDDFDRALMSPQDIKNASKLYVMTDLFGNEVQSIPVKYMSKLEKDFVSLDLLGSVLKYAVSVENNKMLHEINPIAKALESTLADAGIKSANKVSTTGWFSKHFNITVKSSENVRLQTIRNMVERDIEGIENKMEIGVLGNKIANHIMGMAAYGSLAINVPGGIKNLFSARIQNVLESVSGRHFTTAEWKDASLEFTNRYIKKMIGDYNRFANKSLGTQMFELFDPIEGNYAENVGHEGTDSVKTDMVGLKFMLAPQKFGEIQAQGSAWLAMMKHTRVPLTENGVTTMIPYSQAWTLVDGVVRLKPGIPQEWDRTGEEFLKFKAKVHKINELLQGAYAKLNQPEAQRYTLMKLLLFMRKFFLPAFVNRFGSKTANVPLAEVREGYYKTFIRLARPFVGRLYKRSKSSWHLYTEKEKRNFYRTLTEMGYSVAFALLLVMLGYSGDDRNKKLASDSFGDWVKSMLIYEVLMIKAEVETFIPVPGMGMNELLRMKDNPSIAFPIVNRYYKLLGHLGLWVTGDEDARYQRHQGIWDKGDLKWFADMSKIMGYSGNTTNPDEAIKTFSMSMNRY